jgi:uncharacterized protein (TIGR00106 family)
MKPRKVVAEISVVPLGTAEASVSDYVASCLDVAAASKKIKYCLTSMGTIIEGPLEDVLEITRKMHEVPFKKGARRVITTLKIDDRSDKKLTMQGKLDSVKKIRPQVRL